MTDARLPDRWLLDPTFEALSDKAWRIFTSSLMYSAQQETDGHLPASSLRFLHVEGVTRQDADELVVAKLWKRLPKGEFQVADWSYTQSTAAEMATRRENNRARAKKYRSNKKEASDSDASRVTSRVTPEERQGEERTGQERQELPAHKSDDMERVTTAWKQNPPQRSRVA